MIPPLQSKLGFGLFSAVLILSGIHGSLPAEDGTPMPGDPLAAPAPAATFVAGRMIGMRPHEKRPLNLKASERNPYAKRSLEQENAGEERDNAEEIKIRAALGSLNITGRSNGPNGVRVLLGDIILEEGRILPQLLEEQSENLKVVELNADTVVLGWLDIETNELTGKTMQVPYDLAPTVSYALHGQGLTENTGEAGERRMGVLRVGNERKRLESKVVSGGPSREVPREVFKAGQ